MNAVDQAKARGAEYVDALNLAAWVNVVGLDNGSLSPDKFLKRGKSHYHEMRFRAVRYAHRALAVVGQDPEEQARVLATVAMTLGLVGMDYHAVLAEFASLQLIDDKKQ